MLNKVEKKRVCHVLLARSSRRIFDGVCCRRLAAGQAAARRPRRRRAQMPSRGCSRLAPAPRIVFSKNCARHLQVSESRSNFFRAWWEVSALGCAVRHGTQSCPLDGMPGDTAACPIDARQLHPSRVHSLPLTSINTPPITLDAYQLVCLKTAMNKREAVSLTGRATSWLCMAV